MFSDLSEVEIVTRIGLALLLGGILGLERQRKDRPAGLRTYGLVCEGAALFMMGSILIGDEVREDWGTAYDPSRIASTIVQGIGFLAAGVIFTSQGKVQGLTTAAGVWVTAAIGLLVGAGFFLISAAAVACTLIYLVLTDFLERRVFGASDPPPADGEDLQTDDS